MRTFPTLSRTSYFSQGHDTGQADSAVNELDDLYRRIRAAETVALIAC